MKNLVQLRNEMIKFLYNDPNCEFSINDLSKAFNCNKKTIYGLIKQNNIKQNNIKQNNIKQKKINKKNKNNNKRGNFNEKIH